MTALSPLDPEKDLAAYLDQSRRRALEIFSARLADQDRFSSEDLVKIWAEREAEDPELATPLV